MIREKESINKYASIMNRLSQKYFDKSLEPFEIGGGQQFFLLHIYYKPGMSQFELGQTGNFHKGTTARAVQKLEELGYIIRITDESDKRINQLYTTDKAKPAIEEIKKMLVRWDEIITSGLTEDEIASTTIIMEKMASNAVDYVHGRKR